jgi:hypothetical protein
LHFLAASRFHAPEPVDFPEFTKKTTTIT